MTKVEPKQTRQPLPPNLLPMPKTVKKPRIKSK